jgi:hypothetical protein
MNSLKKNFNIGMYLKSIIFWDIMSCSLVEVHNTPKEGTASIFKVKQ